MNHAGKTPAPPADGGADLWGYHVTPHMWMGVLAVGVLVIAWCLIVPRVAHTFRRLGWSALAAGGVAAILVGWQNHVHHAKVVQAAAASGGPVSKQLVTWWAELAAAGTLAFFLAATWWLAQRRKGRLQFRGLRLGRRRGRAVMMAPPGRAPGRAPGGFPYDDDPYGGMLPPGFPPPGRGGRR